MVDKHRFTVYDGTIKKFAQATDIGIIVNFNDQFSEFIDEFNKLKVMVNG